MINYSSLTRLRTLLQEIGVPLKDFEKSLDKLNDEQLNNLFLNTYKNWFAISSQLIDVNTLKEVNTLFKYTVAHRLRQLDLIFLLFYKIKFIGNRINTYPFEYEQVINTSIHLFTKYDLPEYIWVYNYGFDYINKRKLRTYK